MARRRQTDPRQVTFQPPTGDGRSLAQPRTRPAPSPGRTKAVQWTQLINTGTRLDTDTIERLDAACQRTGLGVQGVWEEAINYYCDQLGIPEQMPPGSERDPIPRPTAPAADPDSLTLVTARLTPNTRARLVAGCHSEGQGGQEFIPDALNAWFDHLDETGQS